MSPCSADYFRRKRQRILSGDIDHDTTINSRRREQARFGPLPGYNKVYSSDVQRGILVNEMSLFQGGALQRRWFDFRRVLRSARLHQLPLCCLPFLKASFSWSAQRRASSIPAPSKSFMINEWSREFYLNNAVHRV